MDKAEWWWKATFSFCVLAFLFSSVAAVMMFIMYVLKAKAMNEKKVLTYVVKLLLVLTWFCDGFGWVIFLSFAENPWFNAGDTRLPISKREWSTIRISYPDSSNWGLILTMGSWSVLYFIVIAYVYDNPFAATDGKSSAVIVSENVGEETNSEACCEVL